MEKAPVVMLVYNRPEHTRQTLEALKKNIGAAETDLYIYSDAPKITGESGQDAQTKDLVARVREYLAKVDGFQSVTIVEREKNWGLHLSMIAAVGAAQEKYGRAIVLEDDIVTSPFFLKYMNDALEFYRDEQEVFHIGANHVPIVSGIKMPADYVYDTYFSHCAPVWGWATWRDRWQKGLWDYHAIKKLAASPDFRLRYALGGGELVWAFKKHLSNFDISMRQLDWEICWTSTMNYYQGLALIPRRSYTLNIGLDGSGLSCADHSADNRAFVCDLSLAKETVTYPPRVEINKEIARNFNAYYGEIPLLLFNAAEVKTYWEAIKKESGATVRELEQYDPLIEEVIVPAIEGQKNRRQAALLGLNSIGKSLLELSMIRRNLAFIIDTGGDEAYDGIPVHPPGILNAPREERPYLLVASVHYETWKRNLSGGGWREGADFIDARSIYSWIRKL